MPYKKPVNNKEYLFILLDELVILNLHAQDIQAPNPKQAILAKIQELYTLIESYLD
ncbi:hypothetical protein [Apibacter muscae]|uniref:hypothetical protein n=1 Tax=Apibacter muscae TaxID=2509004 RepID=UPI0016288CB5|nr:hypothetical protein [Apibacter muscae]